MQGYLELADASGKPVALDAKQVETLQQHLALVFVHEIDPSMGDGKHQDKLNDIHSTLIMRC